MKAKRRREPLSDCTNTTTTSSSITKPSANPSVASAIKKLLNSIDGKTILNSNSKRSSTNASENNCDTATGIASTPEKSSRVSEPCSVYSRRKTADKGKSKGKTLAVPLTGALEANINITRNRNKEDGDTVSSRPCTMHKQKKKKHHPQHAMTKDFIEKQRAYFAEIDAFELSEEEVESADQLE